MKLLAITNMYPSTARPWLGTFVEQQVKGLAALGVECQVLFFDRKTEGALVYYRMERRIDEAVAEFDPDLIHVMYGGVMAHQITRRPWSLPVVVTFHGSDLLGENLSGLFRKIVSHYGIHCSRRAACQASGVVVVARHLLKALPICSPRPSDGRGVRGEGLIQPSSLHSPPSSLPPPPSTPLIRVIPCGIDLSRFKPTPQEECRQKLGWSPGIFHVLFPANGGDPVKRPWLAQAAVRELQARGIKAELHFLSNVPYAEVPVWFNASDVLLLTSLHEGSPTVVKEALACNVPVVSVDVGDVAERLQGIDGCHLATPEPEDLALQLLKVWDRKRRVDSRCLMESLSIQAVAKRLQVFYQELLGTTPGLLQSESART